MALKKDYLNLKIPNVPYGLSARRLWEHTQHQQVNPFRPISIESRRRPGAFVDVVYVARDAVTYLGVTLEDFLQNPRSWLPSNFVDGMLEATESAQLKAWLRHVENHLKEASERLAVRNLPTLYPSTAGNDVLGIPWLRCALVEWLKQRRTEKASPQQWMNRIQNLTSKGLKLEELEFSQIKLSTSPEESGLSVTGLQLLEKLDYRQLRISVIPVVYASQNHLSWIPVPADSNVRRIKPKLKGKFVLKPQWRDPVLGYWIDMIEWKDLIEFERHWAVFNHRGVPLSVTGRSSYLFDTPEDAKCKANDHAGKWLPRLSSKGNWADYRLTGGENYREWLVTLPFFPATFFSSHFAYRNVLLHVRSDIRESRDGERVLFLQEIQSDWAQQARRYAESVDPTIPRPPWLQEWPALALKLMLLHAASSGYDALAWTTGLEQIERYGGLGEEGLIELYDRTLPKEADRILRPLGAKRGLIEISLPKNFFIEPTDSGYEVLDRNKNLLGIATTWLQAQRLIPDGAHELLGSMHGIKLSKELRQSILEKGFYAWGGGVN